MDSARCKGSRTLSDLRISVIPDVHGHAKGEHRPFAEERPIPYSARMLFLWFYHACRRGHPRFLMVADHINYLTFEDPGAVNTVRRALKLAHAGDLYGAAETAGVEVAHAAVVSEGLKKGMRFSIGAEVDNDPRARPDAQNIVDAMRPDGIVRTVHFINIDHPEKGADWPWAFDNDEFAHLYDIVGTEKIWELYIAKLLDDLEKLPAHVAGHFYAPANYGHWPAQKTLEGYEDRFLQICHSRGLAVEINTRFLYRETSEEDKKKYLEANARLIRKAKALGVGIAVGSDAHSPKDQGNAFDVILKVLDEAKVNELVFPVGGRLARVALRATREHLEAQAKAKETTSPGSSISGFSRAELGLPEETEKAAAARRETSGRATREGGPKKRAADSTRPAKRAGDADAAAKSTSKRSAESSSSSSKAKAARTAAKDVHPPKKAAPAKHKEKPAAKPVKAPAVKAPPVKAAPAKAAAKKAPAKPAAKAPAKPAVKAAPKPAAKAAPKKSAAPAKKAPAKAAAKKAAPKKPAAKSAAKPKKLAAKPAPKAPAKKAVKKVVKPASKSAPSKKKPAAKRR